MKLNVQMGRGKILFCSSSHSIYHIYLPLLPNSFHLIPFNKAFSHFPRPSPLPYLHISFSLFPSLPPILLDYPFPLPFLPFILLFLFPHSLFFLFPLPFCCPLYYFPSPFPPCPFSLPTFPSLFYFPFPIHFYPFFSSYFLFSFSFPFPVLCVFLITFLIPLSCSHPVRIISITREVELYSTPRMVFEGDDFPEGFNGIIKFHNLE